MGILSAWLWQNSWIVVDIWSLGSTVVVRGKRGNPLNISYRLSSRSEINQISLLIFFGIQFDEVSRDMDISMSAAHRSE